MAHPLFLAVAHTKGMRQLAALQALGLVRDALPRAGVTVRLEGNQVELQLQLPRGARWWLGLAHLWAWHRARRAARRALGMVKSDVVLRKVRPWQSGQTSRDGFQSSIRSPGESFATR